MIFIILKRIHGCHSHLNKIILGFESLSGLLAQPCILILLCLLVWHLSTLQTYPTFDQVSARQVVL